MSAAALEHWVRESIQLPQSELGGLSLAELYELMTGDWATSGALRVRELPAEEVIEQPFVADARTILQYVADGGMIDETAAGFLTREVVADLLPRMRMPTGWPRSFSGNAIDDALTTIEPMTEEQARWLPRVRSSLEIAELLVRRKQGLYVSRRGKALLAPAKAGQLHALLLRAFFLRFDLSRICASDPQPGLQSTIAYTLYRLYEAVPPRWWSGNALSELAWLACVKDAPRYRETLDGGLSHMTFVHRVLEPLVYFGLMEERVPDACPWKLNAEYRVTPLYPRALAFEFGSGEVRPFELVLVR